MACPRGSRRREHGAVEASARNDSAPGTNARGRYEILEHETGFEPATLTLATGKKAKE
jgi:hypothetical protein